MYYDITVNVIDINLILDTIFYFYKPNIYIEDLVRDLDDDDLNFSKIREYKFIIKLLIKECKSLILNKNHCLSNVNISNNILDKIISNVKNINIILSINENKITILDYINLACMIDYKKYNVYYDIFKLAIRKEKINIINNE
jgi:hypothetical protein